VSSSIWPEQPNTHLEHNSFVRAREQSTHQRCSLAIVAGHSTQPSRCVCVCVCVCRIVEYSVLRHLMLAFLCSVACLPGWWFCTSVKSSHAQRLFQRSLHKLHQHHRRSTQRERRRDNPSSQRTHAITHAHNLSLSQKHTLSAYQIVEKCTHDGLGFRHLQKRILVTAYVRTFNNANRQTCVHT
jgi:hypothetical protein